MKYYVSVDIGCIECGESSAVLGIFKDRVKAEGVCADHDKRQEQCWHGQHYFRVFEISKLDTEYRVDYMDTP